MKRYARLAAIALAALLTSGALSADDPSPWEVCSLCDYVADPLGQPCFYWGQPCGPTDGWSYCHCEFCAGQPACVNG